MSPPGLALGLGLGLAPAGGEAPWQLGALDWDIENGRYYFNSQTFTDEAAALLAAGGKTGTKTVGARIIGPSVFGAEVVSDPEFSSGTSGIVDAPTTGANGTPSQAAGRLVLTLTGVGSNYRCRVPLSGLVARRGYYIEAEMAANAGIDSAAVSLSNNTDLGGAASAFFNVVTMPNTQWSSLGNPGSTLYAGFNVNDTALNGNCQFERWSVKECSPFIGFQQETLSGFVDFVTPVAWSGTKVAFELSDGALTRERIRLEANASGVTTFIVTNDASAQVAIALGTLATSTRYRVDFSCAPNRVVAKITGSAPVADLVANIPGLTQLFLGRSASGETWDSSNDLIKRVVIRQGEYLPDGAVWAVGDSYVDGAGGVSLPTTANADGRAMIETSGGGTTLAQQITEMESYPGLCDSGVFIHWDGNGVNGFTDLETAMADYRRMVSLLGHDRFLIIGPLKRANLSEGLNGLMGAVQAALAAEWPGNYINAQAILAARAASPGDDSMVTAGVTPDSLLQADDVHLTSTAMGYVWGDAGGVKATLTAKGW